MLKRVLVAVKPHWAFAVALGVAALIRLLVLVAYRPALWYGDTPEYLGSAKELAIPPVHQIGYPVFLSITHFEGVTVATVTAAQHLIGLALAVLCYAFLQRRHVPKWLSIVGVSPLLFDGFLITMEQFVMADTLFLALLLTGLVLLFWDERPTVWLAFGAGAFLAAATLTRVIGLPVALLAIIYVLLRRAGWRPMLTLAATIAIPLAAYVMLFQQKYGTYGFSTHQGGFFYARVATFVDCDKLQVEERLMRLCPVEPLDARKHQEYYVWQAGAVAQWGEATDIGQEFASAAIAQQPGAYLKVVALDMWHYFDPFWKPDPTTTSYRVSYELAADPATIPLVDASTGRFKVLEESRRSALTEALHWYSLHIKTPTFLIPILLAVVLFALARRRDWANVAAALIVASGMGMVLAMTAMDMHEPRFLLPTIPIVVLGATVSISSLLRRSPERAPEPEKRPAELATVAGN